MTPEDVPGELAKERQRDPSQQYKGGQDNTRVLDDTKTRGRKDRKQGREVGRPMSESPARPRSGRGRPMGGVRGRDRNQKTILEMWQGGARGGRAQKAEELENSPQSDPEYRLQRKEERVVPPLSERDKETPDYEVQGGPEPGP